MDSKLTDSLWEVVQKEFGRDDHTCDMMVLDSNAMLDCCGNQLLHFTPYPTPESAGVNVFAWLLTVQLCSVHMYFRRRCWLVPCFIFSSTISNRLPLLYWMFTLGSIGGLYFSFMRVRFEG